MEVAPRAARRFALGQIDVLAFPLDARQLRRLQAGEARRWRELERRARIALFIGVGMFLAWLQT